MKNKLQDHAVLVTIQKTKSPSCFHQSVQPPASPPCFIAHVWVVQPWAMLILIEIISESASALFFSERHLMTNLRLVA